MENPDGLDSPTVIDRQVAAKIISRLEAEPSLHEFAGSQEPKEIKESGVSRPARYETRARMREGFESEGCGSHIAAPRYGWAIFLEEISTVARGSTVGQEHNTGCYVHRSILIRSICTNFAVGVRVGEVRFDYALPVQI